MVFVASFPSAGSGGWDVYSSERQGLVGVWKSGTGELSVPCEITMANHGKIAEVNDIVQQAMF